MAAELYSSSKTRITNLTGSVIFPCPQCGKEDIVRARGDREKAVKYTCSQCKFEGPH